MNEHELSYVFTTEGAKNALDMNLVKTNSMRTIEDCYLSPDVRIRFTTSSGQTSAVVTKKEGSKSSGTRLETEESIDLAGARILSSQAKLTINKHRFDVTDEKTKITLDVMLSPIQVSIVEIESEDSLDQCYDASEKLFGDRYGTYRTCPLSAWDFCRRKIGICGGPSSGKSETAKKLTHLINTQLRGNSWNVTEYASSFIQKYRRNPEFSDQLLLFFAQKLREEDASLADIVVSDCPTFLSYIYASINNRDVLSKQTALYLSKIYKRVLFDALSYTDIIFLRLQQYVENGVRFHSKTESLEIENRIKRFLEDHRIPHLEATYNDTDRILRDLFYINN